MLQAETIGSMALPVVNSIDDCIDFSKTVTPFITQLYELPQQILQTITNPQGLKLLYVSTNPLISGLAFALALGPIFIVAAEINRNYSQVDRFWSLLPTVYIANFVTYAHLVGLKTDRLDLVLGISALWSTRLTYNYARRGGYSVGSEDYRWVIIQRTIGMPAFHLLNLTFIGPYQCILLYAVTTPVYIMLLYTRHTGEGLNLIDMILGSFMVLFISTSWVADQQQWNYQTAKYAWKDTGKIPAGASYTEAELKRGFNTRGLWRYSRHPNFACEQSVWMTLFWWGCNLASEGSFYNWSGVGVLQYLLLFQGSTWLTEAITAGKYPEYKDYQQQVGMFLPFGGQGYAPKVTAAVQKKLK